MPHHVSLALIVAQARNRVIGAGGRLPWRQAGDLAFFKRTTMGAPIVMGRKTWESLPRRPLPGRANIILSRNWEYAAEGARVYTSLAPALAAARAIAARAGMSEAFIIGGSALYEMALPFADRIYLTDVDAAPEGDAWFPEIDAGHWQASELERGSAGDGNDHAYTIRRLDRIAAPA
jgi:dihydrofolate reductase